MLVEWLILALGTLGGIWLHKLSAARRPRRALALPHGPVPVRILGIAIAFVVVSIVDDCRCRSARSCTPLTDPGRVKFLMPASSQGKVALGAGSRSVRASVKRRSTGATYSSSSPGFTGSIPVGIFCAIRRNVWREPCVSGYPPSTPHRLWRAAFRHACVVEEVGTAGNDRSHPPVRPSGDCGSALRELQALSSP